MKRFAAVALVVLAFGLVGCSGGGSSEPDPVPYNFNGRWMVSSQITKNTCGNGAIQGEIVIAQSGGTVIVQVADGRVGNGACDTGTGAILFDVPSGTGSVTRWSGTGTTETTMTGTRAAIGAGCEFEANWTAILIARN